MTFLFQVLSYLFPCRRKNLERSTFGGNPCGTVFYQLDPQPNFQSSMVAIRLGAQEETNGV